MENNKMIKEDLTSHIEDIIKSINTESEKLDQKELENELKKFIEYGVPVEQAKKTIIKKYGGEIIFNNQSNSERTLISKLKPNEYSVNLLCRVITINPKEILVKGENRQIFYGILGDESGTIPFTSWKNIDVEKDDVIEISNAYTREWQGNIQLNFGDRINIEKTEKSKLPQEAYDPKKIKVNELKSGIGSVDITVIILDIKERDVEVNGENKKVFSGIIGDDTGKAQFTSWFDFKLKKDTTYQIIGGYVKSWKGIPQLTFDEKSKVTKINKKIFEKDKINTKKIPIHELIDKRGAIDIKVEGTIIDIKEGSGFITRCSKCNRTLKNDECTVHGKVDVIDDLRIKLIIDDETGAINSILNKEITEKILNKTLEECKKISNDKLINEITKKMFTKRMIMTGNALSDTFGTTLIVKDAHIVNIDIKKESQRINQELEGLQ
jgi:replication factor A1